MAGSIGNKAKERLQNKNVKLGFLGEVRRGGVRGGFRGPTFLSGQFLNAYKGLTLSALGRWLSIAWGGVCLTRIS